MSDCHKQDTNLGKRKREKNEQNEEKEEGSKEPPTKKRKLNTTSSSSSSPQEKKGKSKDKTNMCKGCQCLYDRLIQCPTCKTPHCIQCHKDIDILR